jgi:K+-transporting ATPase ATPase C chain
VKAMIRPAVSLFVVLTVVTGVIYPLAVTGVAKAAFPSQAAGSLIVKDGKTVGSSLIGQNFTDPKYFWPRPSAAGADGYDGLASGASNLGPSNPKLLDTVKERVAAYREANHLAADAPVPVDAVTGSGSGLDPAISVANARLQTRRVALARRLDPDEVLKVVAAHTQTRQWGFLGEDSVNVLELNLALDRLGGS